MPPRSLVLGGGGIRGFSFVGALKYLEQRRPLREAFTHVAGTSIGSLIGLMVVLGYTVCEMEEETFHFNFESLSEELKSLDTLQVAERYGINSGDLLVDQIKQIIRRKTKNGNVSLQELYERWSNGMQLDIVTVNVNQGKTAVLNHSTAPELPVYKAVRMSVSVPLLFHPVRYKGDLYVDGGLLSNFPMHCVPKGQDAIGFRIGSGITGDVSTFQAYITSIIYGVLQEMEELRLTETGPRGIVVDIDIPANAPAAFQFKISDKNKRRLIKLGYTEAKKALKDYCYYVEYEETSSISKGSKE